MPRSTTKIDANLMARFRFTGSGYTLVDQDKGIRQWGRIVCTPSILAFGSFPIELSQARRTSIRRARGLI
jgi:hypothetical protein